MQHITANSIDPIQLFTSAKHPDAGAIVLFSGEVRGNSHGKEVAFLSYEAQERMADKMIGTILQEAIDRWKLTVAKAVHRIGNVGVSEPAVVVITASAHRSEAYAANRFVIDKIKHEVPIWKCEHFTDGSSEWGGNCNCRDITGDPHRHVYEFDDDSPQQKK